MFSIMGIGTVTALSLKEKYSRLHSVRRFVRFVPRKDSNKSLIVGNAARIDHFNIRFPQREV
jgi:hypothetical protein